MISVSDIILGCIVLRLGGKVNSHSDKELVDPNYESERQGPPDIKISSRRVFMFTLRRRMNHLKFPKTVTQVYSVLVAKKGQPLVKHRVGYQIMVEWSES